MKVAYVNTVVLNLSREGAACNEGFQTIMVCCLLFLFGSFLQVWCFRGYATRSEGICRFSPWSYPSNSSKCFALELHPFNCFVFCEVRMLWNLKLSSNKVISWGSLNNDVESQPLLYYLFFFKSGKSSCQEQKHLVLFSFSCPTKFPKIFFSAKYTTNLPSFPSFSSF